MKVGVLNICTDSPSNANIQPALFAKLIDSGIDIAWVTSANKNTFDYVYSLCYSTPDGVILIGQVKQFLSFLKTRYSHEFNESVFYFDGIRFVVLPNYQLDKIDEILEIIRPLKQKLKIVKFGIFGKSIDQIKNTLGDVIINKSKIKFDFCFDNDNVIGIIRIPNKVEDVVINDILNKISNRLSDNLYSVSDVSLVEQVAQALRKANLKIALAESYTAGGIANALCSINGASDYFCESMVCYSDNAKQRRLGVQAQTINNHGIVSEEVAYEMAAGLLVNNPQCDLVVATTGFASNMAIGDIDVTGLCYLALGSKDGIHIFRQQFVGSRQDIMKKGVAHAIFRLYKALAVT